MIRVKNLITSHDRHQVFCFRQIDNVVCPTGNHMDSLNLIAGNLELYCFAGIDIALLNQTVTSHHNDPDG